MKTRILTTVAAALVAGVSGLTFATGASASHFKLNMRSACDANSDMLLNVRNTSSTAYSSRFCVLHTIRTEKRDLRFGSMGIADFRRFEGLKATPANLMTCMMSVVILSFYKRTRGGWRIVQSVKARAAPKVSGGKIKYCQAVARTKYASGADKYRTIVKAIDGKGRNTGNPMRSNIHARS